jgi:hypothetical protein
MTFFSAYLARQLDDHRGQSIAIASGKGFNMRRNHWIAIAALALAGTTFNAAPAGPPPPFCPGDLDGSGSVNIDDLLGIINAWGPCAGCVADITGNGQVDIDDLLAVINGWGTCPDPCNFSDVRIGIEGAVDDPPDIQRNYDTINRTTQLLRDIPLEAFFNLEFNAHLPIIFARLELLEACTGLATDVAAVNGALQLIGKTTMGVPLRDVLTSLPGEFVEAKQAIDALRMFKIAFPPFAANAVEADARNAAINALTTDAGDRNYRDFYEAIPADMSPVAVAAFELGKATGILKFQAIDDNGISFGACNNDRCCCTVALVNTEQCIAATDKFCKLRIDGNLCQIGADKCSPAGCP